MNKVERRVSVQLPSTLVLIYDMTKWWQGWDFQTINGICPTAATRLHVYPLESGGGRTVGLLCVTIEPHQSEFGNTDCEIIARKRNVFLLDNSGTNGPIQVGFSAK